VFTIHLSPFTLRMHWSICHTLDAFGPSGSAMDIAYTSSDRGAAEEKGQI